MQLQAIYRAKCDDLGIPILSIQENRFFEYCSRYLSNRHFNLAESGVGPVAGKVIADAIRNNPSFCKLTLAKNILGDTGAIILVRTLARALNLIHLDISSNSISPSGATDVLKVITTHGSIVSFDISSHEGLHRNRLGIQGAMAVVQLLRRNKLLLILNVAGTALGNDGLECIVPGIVENKALLALNIANNGITGKVVEQFIRAVAFSKLTHLNLSGNKLGNYACDYLSALLMGSYGTMCPLRFLDISKNEIGFPGSGKLFAGMGRNAILETLIMNDNPITGAFNLALCNFLCDNLALKQLDLTNCDLRSNGAAAVGKGLSKNHGLKSLCLGSNSLDVRIRQDDEMQNFAAGLETNTALRSLDLTDNKITDKGGVLLCSGLRKNIVLERLLLKDNDLHDQTGQLLAELTRKEHNLVKLSLENNPISYKYVNEIRSNLVSNERIQSKNKAPIIRRQLRELEMQDYDSQRIERDMAHTLEEQRKAEDQLEKQKEKFNQLKEVEEEKTQAVMQELEEVKQVKVQRGQEYLAILSEITAEREKTDDEYKELDDRLGVVALEVNKTMKDCNPHAVTNQKRNYAERRAKCTLDIARMNEELENHLSKRKMDEMTLQAMQKQIAVQKAEIEALNAPKPVLVVPRPGEATVAPKKGEFHIVSKKDKSKKRTGKKSGKSAKSKA